MARKMFLGVSVVALALMLSSASFANPVQITFGPSTTGFVSVSTSNVTFNGLSGLAYQGSDTGTFSLADASISTTGVSNGTYTLAANSEVLSFTIAGPGTLTGDLSLATVTPVGNVALFVGTFTITSATSGFVTTGYPVGAVVDIDFTSYKTVLSAGEVIPDPVPEPGTFALVGSGLLAVAGFLRRKL